MQRAVGACGPSASEAEALLSTVECICNIPSLAPPNVCCQSPAQYCCSVTGALHCARLIRNSSIDSLITECFPLSISWLSARGPRASPRLLGLREEGSSQSRKAKAGKAFLFLNRTGQQVAGVLTGFGCVLRLSPMSLPFSVSGDHVIFISALCDQGRTFQKVLT